MTRKHLWLCLLVLFGVGCERTQSPSYGTYGRFQRVELWSGGQKVQEWRSIGQPEYTDDVGWSFRDKDSGQIVRITGDVVVTTTNVGD